MMYETKDEIQSFILVGVDVDRAVISAEDSLDELAELLSTAGGEEAGRVIQKMEAINSKTYVGSGKVQEIKTLLAATGAHGIICDDELTPAQLKNLSDLLDNKIKSKKVLEKVIPVPVLGCIPTAEKLKKESNDVHNEEKA